MSFGTKVLQKSDALADRLACVVGAVLFSQAPEFMQQYWQRLGGHLDEARRQLEQFRHTAEQASLSLDEFTRQTAANADPAVARLAGVMADATSRVHFLQDAYDALGRATVWSRPFVFFQHLDTGIARATWTAFKPAVPTTIEGLVYALAGLLVLLGCYHLGCKPVVRRVVRRAAPVQTSRSG